LLIEVDPTNGLTLLDARAILEQVGPLVAPDGAVGARHVLLVRGSWPSTGALGRLGELDAVLLLVDEVGLDLGPGAPGWADALAGAAAFARCLIRDAAVVAPAGAPWLTAAAAIGALPVPITVPGPDAPRTSAAEQVAAAVDAARASEARSGADVGIGPHPAPWPDDDRLDPELLAAGDRRNVVDRFRYWSEAAIVADLDARRHRVHVAVENWQHDLNIGTVVRNANAFNVAGVHIVGHRRWNRRGAMATDRYLAVHHHATVDELGRWAADEGLELVGIDNVPGSVDLDAGPLPRDAVLVLGQEGPGLSAAMVAACSTVRSIGQHGSTRSLNAGVASGIALHAWVREHGQLPPTWPEAPPVP
jgi:tRNA(Leu) C34 or U34 (ribose-2'-O)-methylase TrmL